MLFHEIADMFPLMNADEFERFCSDIKVNGLLEPIWTYQGKIIDGRNRFNACKLTNQPTRFQEWHGNGSLLDFIVSINLHRRHLSESQRAMVAAKIANLESGQRASQICEAVSQNEAAEMFSVSPRLVSSAKKILETGITDLQEMVEVGELSVSAAASIAAQPKGKQKRLVKKKDKSKIVAYAANLRVEKKLKSARTLSQICLCHPKFLESGFDESDFLAFLHATEQKLKSIKGGGVFARYIRNSIDEIEEMGIAGEMREDYELILSAIDKGFQTESEIVKFTGLDRAVFQYEVKYLVDGGTLEAIAQGGKPEGARGQRKTLYIRCEKFDGGKPLPEKSDFTSADFVM